MRPIVLAVACSMLVIACQKEREPEVAALSKEEIDGASRWRRIAEETDYSDYAQWPGHEGVQPGQAPHGPYHRVYVNLILRGALPAADKRAPVGSVIVKENMDAERNLAGLTVMVKVAGYAPEGNDWFWAKYAPGGAVQAEGKVKGCIACHEGMRDNDYVIIRRLDRPLEQ